VDGRRGLAVGTAAWIFGLVLSVGAFAGGLLAWETELALQSVDPIVDLDASFATLRANYAWGDAATGASGAFGQSNVATGENGAAVAGTIGFPVAPNDRCASIRLSGYLKDDYVVEWPVGTYGVSADVSFGIDPAAFRGFSAAANLTAYGLSTTLGFSLAPAGAGFATGLTLEVAGTLLSGMGIAATVRLGAPMGPGAPPADPCALDFSSLEVFFDGFPWCCVYVGFRTIFDYGGFDRAEIDFDLSALGGVLSLVGDLVFELQTKTLTLTPGFQFGVDDCIWLNVAVDPAVTWGSSGSGAISAIVIRGLGITGCNIGAAKFSAIASIAGGLYKSKGADDIGLRATGYYIALAPSANPGAYEQTDYDMIWTLETGFANADLAIDTYLGASSSKLFDLALITAEYAHQLSAGFDMSLGFLIDPTGGPFRLVVRFDASTSLP
jgi:hypothetical protein